MNRKAGLFFATILTCLLSGCSDVAGTVSGTIKVDGSPLGGFEVTYINQANGAIFVGYAKGDGRYEVFGGKGSRDIPTGDYKVTVEPTGFVSEVPRPKVKFPDTYTDPARSELTRTVASGANVVDFDLTSKN